MCCAIHLARGGMPRFPDVRLKCLFRSPLRRSICCKRYSQLCTRHYNSAKVNSVDRNKAYLAQRSIHTSNLLLHGEYEWQDPKSEDEVPSSTNWVGEMIVCVNITIFDSGGTKHNIRGKVGDNILYLAHRYGIDMEGACEASLACTTCHVYVEEDFYERLQEPTEEEEDLLDLAPLLASNSRLGCQIILTKEMEGLVLRLPKVTRNFYVDGFKPQPH